MIGIQFRYFKKGNLGSEYNSDILRIEFYLNNMRRNQVLDFEKLLSLNSGKFFHEISESCSYNHARMPFFPRISELYSVGFPICVYSVHFIQKII